MSYLKKIPIHPTFYLLVLWFLFCGLFLEFMTFIIVLMIHEYGHYIVSKRCGYTLDKFYIAPYGVCLNYKEKQFEKGDEVKIALAGPCANFVIAFSIIGLWWVFPNFYSYSYLFVEQNLLLALFNLLPAYPLDGGRFFVALLSKKITRKKAIKYTLISNIIFSVLFFLLFIVSWFYSFNPTLALSVFFLLSGVFMGNFEAKYMNSFLLKKQLIDFSKPRILIVSDRKSFNDLLKKIDGSSYTIFNIVSKKGEVITLTEKQVIDICVKYNGNQEVGCLFK